MIKIGENNITMKVGSDDVSAAYLGNELVYSGGTPTHDYSQDYLTFVAKQDSTFQFTNTINYSLDNGSTWTTLASNTPTSIVATGDKILWKATGLTPTLNSGIGRFSSTGQFDVEGNAMSLLYGDNFVGQTSLAGKNYALSHLFDSNIYVVSAENLVLPTTTLANRCYYNMFAGCTSLTTAPELPATTLAAYCYAGMFKNCTNLNYIKCLATDISASTCTNNWVRNVASTGTFVKAASMTDWPSGGSGIPSNWTVVDNV